MRGILFFLVSSASARSTFFFLLTQRGSRGVPFASDAMCGNFNFVPTHCRACWDCFSLPVNFIFTEKLTEGKGENTLQRLIFFEKIGILISHNAGKFFDAILQRLFQTFRNAQMRSALPAAVSAATPPL